MFKNKLYNIIFLIIVIIILYVGCLEQQNGVEKIKYKSTEIIDLAEKQGKMTFDITIRTNETAETVRLWVPYPVSNKNQKVENVTITGNQDYSGIYREGVYGNMILYAEWDKPQTFPNLN